MTYTTSHYKGRNNRKPQKAQGLFPLWLQELCIGIAFAALLIAALCVGGLTYPY